VVEFLLAGFAGTLFFYLAGFRVTPGFLHYRTVIGLSRIQQGIFIARSEGKMFCLQPGIGTMTENHGQPLQGYFDIPETDTIANTQCNFPDTNPTVIPVQESTIPRIAIQNADKTVSSQFKTGMET
jgi:hypothetical protein